MNVGLLFGPLLIGVFLNTILYGILIVQSFIYYRNYRRDPPWQRYFILFLVICDTLNTVFDIGVVFEPLVSRYGTPRAVERIPVMLYVDPIMTVIISTSVQLFICWRIRVINGSWTIPCFIGFFIFCSLVGGIATSICSTILVEFAQLETFKGAVITWLASSAIADICITLSLVISLKKRRTGFSKSGDDIDRIIRLTIHTGAVTALFATMDLVLFVAVPGTSLNFAFDFPLAKLYTNSLLSTLNARQTRHTINAQQRPADNVLFGPQSWNSNSSNSRKKQTDQYTPSHSKATAPGPNSISEIALSVVPALNSNPGQKGDRSFDIDLESDIDVATTSRNAPTELDVPTTNESLSWSKPTFHVSAI